MRIQILEFASFYMGWGLLLISCAQTTILSENHTHTYTIGKYMHINTQTHSKANVQPISSTYHKNILP